MEIWFEVSALLSGVGEVGSDKFQVGPTSVSAKIDTAEIFGFFLMGLGTAQQEVPR
jgi:hypothetical protein